MEIMDNMMLQGTIVLSLLCIIVPRTHIRKTNSGLHTADQIKNAMELINQGNKKRAVAILTGLASPQDRAMLVTEEWFAQYLLNSANDIIVHTKIELWKLFVQRQSLRGNAAYEIGFLIRTTEERYRKMVDLYNVSMTMDSILRTRDHILHLQKIEKLHWDIMHLANMLHEVEKKYKIRPQQMEKITFYPFGVTPANVSTKAPRNTTTTTTTTENNYG